MYRLKNQYESDKVGVNSTSQQQRSEFDACNEDVGGEIDEIQEQPSTIDEYATNYIEYGRLMTECIGMICTHTTH